jgi:hypothetical protein
MSQAPEKKNEKDGHILEEIVTILGNGAKQLWLGTVVVG